MPEPRLLYVLGCAIGALNGGVLAVHAWYHGRGAVALNRLFAALLISFSLRVSKTVWVYFHPAVHPYLDWVWLVCFAAIPILWTAYGARLARARGTSGTGLRWFAAACLPVSVLAAVSTHFDPLRKIVLGLLVLFAASIAWWAWLSVRLAKTEPPAGRVVVRWSIALTAFMTVDWAIYMATAWVHFNAYDAEARFFSVVGYLLIYVELRAGLLGRVHALRRETRSTDDPLLVRLRALMDGEKAYRDPGLTLPALAQVMKISRQALSQLLNNDVGASFNEYVNRYRVEECKARMAAPGGESRTIESIAYDCGFNSLSSFYAAFKKCTGSTPSAFAAALQQKRAKSQVDQASGPSSRSGRGG